MEVLRMEVSPLMTNCYLVWDEKSGDGIVIDPGGNGDRINRAIDAKGIRVVAVIDTHGHWDHIGANGAVKEHTGAPLFIHEDDAAYLGDPSLNISNMVGTQAKAAPADGYLKEGDRVVFGSCALTVLHTPGHTPGDISLYGENVLFSGDTLFFRSVGRSDLPGGDYRTLIDSIRNKIFTLDDNTVVYTGHGIPTRVGDEKSNNPFVRV